jgi:hypothetical protein
MVRRKASTIACGVHLHSAFTTVHVVSGEECVIYEVVRMYDAGVMMEAGRCSS